MSLVDFILVALGVLALWGIGAALEDIADSLTKLTEDE